VTVENRTNTGVFSPTDERKLAFWRYVSPVCNRKQTRQAPYSKASDILGALKVAKSPGSAGMHHTLQRLGSVEVLLLLEEEDIARHGNAADCLAMRPVVLELAVPSIVRAGPHLRVRERDALVVCEVQAVILSLPARNTTGYFGDDVRGALVGALHVARARAAKFSLQSGTHGRGYGLQGVLAGIQLVGVEAHVGDERTGSAAVNLRVSKE
jgi:hypothetical protein